MDKERSFKNKFIIMLCSIVFIGMTIYFIILSKSLADYRFMVGDKLRFNSFIYSLQSLFTYNKQRNLFFILEGSLIILIGMYLYSKIASPKKFESNVVEITPAIHIPSPAGQGQFGSKWFLDNIHETTYKKQSFFDCLFKRKKKEVFNHNTIDFDNEKIKYLIETGDEDIKDKMNKLNQGVSILDIEKEIKEERIKNELDIQKKKDEEQYKEQFGFSDENDNFADINDEMIESFNLENAINDAVEIEDYENDINVAEEMLVKKYADEVAKKNEEELKKEKPYDAKEDKNKLFKKGGLITGIYSNKEEKKSNFIIRLLKKVVIIGSIIAFLTGTKIRNSEDVYYIDKDTHSVIIGATRSGKSRCVVMESIANTALAGESIVVTDPKGELYAYTHKFMEKLGYEVICLDFKNAKCSSKYNLLQPIINAKNDKTEEHPNGDIELIVKYSEELANMMFKETKGENPMWVDNAKSMVTGAILSLILENDDESLINISNVYRFILNGEGKDISPNKDNMYLFIKALQMYKPDSPIIDTMLQIINSPPETRGGFSSNAGSATRLFTQPSIWEITHKSNVDLSKMGERKQILYFILPDQDKSYYKIVSIIVKQMYNELVKVSDKYGGRLPIRVNFYLDEFGNFAPLPDLDAMLTVAGGRGMRFNLFLQGFPQITKTYDKETTEIVKSNCETWVYLKANDTATLEEISKKLGSYTIYSNSESMSLQNGSTTSQSSSQSLQKRSLLLPEEVMAIDRPYLLVMNGNNKPAITEAPDLSKLGFNKMFGMGDEEYNNRLRMIRDRQRTIMKDEEKMEYWSVFQDIGMYCSENINNIDERTGKPKPISDNEYICKIVEYMQEKEKLAA